MKLWYIIVDSGLLTYWHCLLFVVARLASSAPDDSPLLSPSNPLDCTPPLPSYQHPCIEYSLLYRCTVYNKSAPK